MVVFHDLDKTLPEEIAGSRSFQEPSPDTLAWLIKEYDIRPLAEVERTAIEQAIKVCRGNIPKAAALLEVAPSTLYRKLATW